MNNNLLLIFYRNPELGKVKTRLAATVGDEKALELYKKMASFTNEVVKQIDADKMVMYSHTVEQQDLWPEDLYEKAAQKGNDLGSRMMQAFENGFNKGYKQICIIGTDCLELRREILDDAFTVLKKHDFVLGPAKDGGYYLMGMNKMYPEFFKQKQWSTHTVGHDTLRDAIQLKLSYKLLPLLSDVDVEEDLKGKLLEV